MRWIFAALGVAWLACFCSVILFLHPPETFLAMRPAEWGEFLSGVFGPLGLLAILATLIQQSQEIKEQNDRHVDLLEQTKQQLEKQSQHVEQASKQAHAAAQQTELAIQKLQIERVTNRIKGLAMLVVRYSDRIAMHPVGTDESIALIGAKVDLQRDYELGPEMVLETLRQSAVAHTKRLRNWPGAGLVLNSGEKQKIVQLLDNLGKRIEATYNELQEPQVKDLPEVGFLKTDLSLGGAKQAIEELMEVINAAQAAS